MAQIDEEIRCDVKILQLTGNKNLERLLELVDDKLSGNPLLCNNSLKVSAVEKDDKFSKIVNFIDVLSVKVDALSRDHGRDQVNLKCTNCGKNYHDEQQCFKLKTCLNATRKDTFCVNVEKTQEIYPLIIFRKFVISSRQKEFY